MVWVTDTNGKRAEAIPDDAVVFENCGDLAVLASDPQLPSLNNEEKLELNCA